MVGGTCATADRPLADRRGGLVACGLVLILLGVFCALVAALSLLPALLPAAAAPGLGGSLRTALAGALMYSVLALVLGWLGVGLMRARRWARALALVVGWVWLLSGLASLALAALVWAPTRDLLADVLGVPLSWAVWMMLGVALILVVLHVVLPGVLVVFLRRADVQATCARRGPERQWADELSPHTLSLALLYLIGALSIVALPLYGLPLPVFTLLLRGPAAVLGELVLAALCLGLAAATLARRHWAWWAALLGSVLAAASTIVSSFHFEISELLAASSLSPEELAPLQIYAALRPVTLAWIWGSSWLSLVAYLLVVRRQVVQGKVTTDSL